MRHLWTILLGSLATVLAFLALREWTASVRLSNDSASIEPLFVFARVPGMVFVIAVAATAILAETVVGLGHRPRAATAKALLVVSGVVVVVSWALSYAAQVARVGERLAPAASRAGQCGLVGTPGCPRFAIGDGAIIALVVVWLVVALVVLAVRGRWSEALFAAFVTSMALDFVPHVGWYVVDASGARPRLWTEPKLVFALPFFLALALWWTTHWLGWSRRWWWFVVGLVVWGLSLAVTWQISTTPDDVRARMQSTTGVPVGADGSWSYAFLPFYLLVPIWLLVSWLTERRRAVAAPRNEVGQADPAN